MPHSPIAVKFPHILHGGDYNPEQWLSQKDTIWKEDMRLAKLAGVNSLSIGIFSWVALEPREGEYTFEWLDEVMDMLAENKMAAVLATPSGSKPAWLSRKHPEVCRVNRRRERELHGGRHNHCLSSPIYRKKVTEINTLLAKRYAGHPALAVWHISNEYGGECHCPLCQEAFRAFLKKRYGSLDALNAAWWTAFWSHTYTSWDEIESPSPLGEECLHGLNLDWMRFTTEQFVDFYIHETKPLKEFTPGVPCTANLMGTYPGIDYFRLAEVLDIASWDNYPQWTGGDDAKLGARIGFLHDLTRSLKDKPFMLMESSPSATNWSPVAKLRKPGVHMLQSMQAVAHGSDTVQYFQYRKSRGGPEKFHGAVVDHEGTEDNRIFREVAQVGVRLKTLDAVVGSDVPSKVAVIYDWQTRWALDDVKGLLQNKTGYEETVIAHHRALWKIGLPIDVIDQTRSFDKYSVIAAPMLYLLRDGVAQKIDNFVQNGGTFIATYITGYVDKNDLCFLGGFPGGGLMDTLGIRSEEIDALYLTDKNSLQWEGKKYEVFDFCETLNLKGANTIGVYGADFYKDSPALTVHKRGKGKAYYIACRTGDDFLDAFYERVTEEAGIKRLFSAPLPHGVNVQIRTNGKREFVFIMNFTNEEKRVDTSPYGKIITLAPFGVEIIESANN